MYIFGDNYRMTNILLCGGNGTRLWPLSRSLMPKQFVQIFDNESLFQKSIKRNQKLCQKICVVSNTEQYFLAQDQLESLDVSKHEITYLLEPLARNTAPAIALACLSLNQDDIVLVTPSDHLIKDEEAYAKVAGKAKKLAEENYIVTFGIPPTYPEIGFGYIEAENENVLSFTEKPDFLTAQKYIDMGNYYWNSGMFCFKVNIFLSELKKYSPEIYKQAFLAYKNAKKDKIIRIHHEDMVAIPEDSIDYALMEKSTKVKVIPSHIDWSDLGSFETLDAEVKSMESVISINSSNNFILAKKQIATIDVHDLIIIDTPDALLVTKKGSSHKVREIVKQLKDNKSELSNVHTTVHRPWGTYTILDESHGYKVKQIVVKMGKRLSLQKHYHRSEHWVVVSGMALVSRGNDDYIVNANESTYIPIGEVHRLENVGNIPLVMIEAQVGEYVGEDDIIRIEDDYERN